eukprot:6339567-Pyramimonas_sp.AAC.1
MGVLGHGHEGGGKVMKAHGTHGLVIGWPCRQIVSWRCLPLLQACGYAGGAERHALRTAGLAARLCPGGK